VSAIAGHAWLMLRLNFRNRLAIIYGYLFPLVFLAAFWVLYRHEPDPLFAHMGELLTVTALGGACFGLPTALVAERERGVWRRYQATPQPTGAFVASVVASRYLLLLSAGIIQIGIAMAFGMAVPGDPPGLLLAFTVVSGAFIGLGMVVAMLAGSVPAVQALGQCIFLPMLMIGGVAIRVESLPDWAQHVAAFFPGRYAVAAIQQGMTGGALHANWFGLVALAVTGLAGGIVAASLFRWDNRRRRPRMSGLILGVGLWLAIGIVAQLQGRAVMAHDWPDRADVGGPERYVEAERVRPPPRVAAHAAGTGSGSARGLRAASWRDVQESDIAQVAFERLPPDAGLVAPIAPRGTLQDGAVAAQIATIRQALAAWPPAREPDMLQRTRNYLAVAAVPDLLQMDPLEQHLPWLIFDRLRQDIPPADLRRIFYWIAMHPDEGEDSAIGQLAMLGLPAVQGPTGRVRERIMLYAFKLLGRLESRQPAG